MPDIKRRRYTRYEISLAATLFVENTAGFMHSIIRDFCSGGLFLEFKQPSESKNLVPQQNIQIFFTVKLEQGEQDFSVDAKIMHISAAGMGIAFEKNYKNAFEALKKQVQHIEDLASSNKQSKTNNSPKQTAFDKELASLLQKVLPAIIDSFFQRSETKLQEAATLIENAPYSKQILDAIVSLKINKKLLFKNFHPSNQDLTHLTSTVSENTKSSLSLIEKSDFEDWLNLLVVVRNLESVYELQLGQMQNKMALILGTDNNRVVNPASPEKLCEYFRNAIATIENQPQVKCILYTIFEETLFEFLPDLYSKMNTFLVDFEDPEHDTPKNESHSSWKNENSSTSHLDTDHLLYIKPTHNASPSPSIESGINKSVRSEQPSVVANTPHTVVSDAPSAITSSSNIRVLSKQPVVSVKKHKPVANVASNLLHLVQGGNFPQHHSMNNEQVSSEYSTKEITTALAYIQQNSANDTYTQSNPELLEKELQKTLNEFSTSEKNISSTDKNNLEVYENLFEVLLNEMVLTDEVKSYLQRIYLPVLDQAMQDPNFLESNSHPARNIVNHLSWLESAIMGNIIVNNTKIRESLDQLIDQIANDPSPSTETFSSVEQQLNKITESVYKSIDFNTHRVTEVYEGKQKLEKARQSVQEEFNRHLAGKKIPKIIVSLLGAGWQHLLVMAKLNGDNNSFQSHLRTINNLYGWLTQQEKPSKELADSTLEFIGTQLQSVCTNTFKCTQIIDDLNSLLLDGSIPAESDAMKLVTIKKNENTRAIKKDLSKYYEVNQLKVGEWLSFLLNQQLEPLKLAWTSDIRDLFVFVNRSGIKKLDLKSEKLADLFNNGKVKKIESLDMPVMDRATDLMLQKMQDNIVHSAIHDPVTELLNRKEFIKQLKLKLNNLDNAQHILCNIEVQDFRVITNACGLPGGDALLKQLADVLKSYLDTEEIIARLDDKTFSILLKNNSVESVEVIAKNLQSELISQHFKWEDKSFAIAVSIGVMPLSPENSYDIDSVLQNVDTATFSANDAGRNRIQVFKDDDQSLITQYNVHEWAGRIDQVFAEKRLFLRCQKIASADPNISSHTHYEILLGIKDENDNVIPPDDFIPAVERCQRMSEVDRWVVLEVFDWIEQHEFDFDMLDGFSINLSGESVNSQEFLDFLKATLSESDIPLEKITFEITETVAANSFQFIQKFIKEIKQFNCKFSLDDFGSGYSSYSYLKSLDVDYLKIDGAFVKDMLNNNADVAIVKSMNEIAHALGLETIAEYVENEDIHAMLNEIGVDFAQGWGIQKPILLADLG